MRSAIAAVLWLLTLLVGLRFVLLVLGAPSSNVFISWVYSVSTPLAAPFSGLIGQPTVIGNGLAMPSVFDWASLLALIVYGLIGSLFGHLSSNVAHRHHHVH